MSIIFQTGHEVVFGVLFHEPTLAISLVVLPIQFPRVGIFGRIF
jgi:hypothetical protein